MNYIEINPLDEFKYNNSYLKHQNINVQSLILVNEL